MTAGAGATLADLQRFLADHQMQVPLRSPWPDATLGGIVAANQNSPGRMRYGSIRDLLLCATVAMADGRVIRAGRPVVKNVAGYDLPKLFVGSFGTLGLLTDLTFKLAPLPRERRTLCVPLAHRDQGIRLSRQVLALASAASGILLADGVEIAGLAEAPHSLLYSAEGLAEDVAAELEQVGNRLRREGAPLVVEVETAADAIWSGFLGEAPQDQMLARTGVATKSIGDYMQALSPSVNQQSRVLIDCASGLIYVKTSSPDRESAKRWLDGLRQAALRLAATPCCWLRRKRRSILSMFGASTPIPSN
ncbi:MAG: FAD-binding oxidoreductase [Caldilineaceae bacterium]|nr:FAD-binding oxidoreductase [Caldilineaceae bacterium]